MNNKPPLPLQKLQEKSMVAERGELRPQMQTLKFIRLFARNYQLEPRMPKGLREINPG